MMNLKKDSYFSRNIELFVFEEDIARPFSSNEVFLNEVEEADVYIGLIGQHYGGIFKMVFQQLNINTIHSLQIITKHIFSSNNVIQEMKAVLNF